MSINGIWTALAGAVEDRVDGLNCLGFSPDSIPEPCFYPLSVEITPVEGYGAGDDVLVTCRLLVSRSDDRAGQEALNDYLSRTGPKSVRAALAAARPLMVDGVACDLRVERITAYGEYLIGTTYYFGAQILIRVIGG
jgi:hypothetical protein